MAALNESNEGLRSEQARSVQAAGRMCTGLPMMSMSGSFQEPGAAAWRKPSERREASAQNTMMLARLPQSDWMSTQLRQRLQCSCRAR